MVKKKKMIMKLPFIFQNDTVQATWTWPSCQQQPKTLSFRADHETATPKATIEDEDVDPVESVIKGLKSERLFFEPGETKTSSIMEEATKLTPFKESIVLSMESRDPHFDFRESMEAMVEANQGLKNNWEGLEELLCWYLKANERNNHGYIFGAFIDLLVKLAVSSSSTTTTNDTHNKNKNNCIPSCSSSYPSSQSPSSPLSFYSSSSSPSSLCSSSSEDNSSTTTPCVSSLSDQKEIINEEDSKDDVSSRVIQSATAI